MRADGHAPWGAARLRRWKIRRTRRGPIRRSKTRAVAAAEVVRAERAGEAEEAAVSTQPQMVSRALIPASRCAHLFPPNSSSLSLTETTIRASYRTTFTEL